MQLTGSVFAPLYGSVTLKPGFFVTEHDNLQQKPKETGFLSAKRKILKSLIKNTSNIISYVEILVETEI
ncbi:MAG: hypothetical protein KME29_34005 [Calothrix sp. FI2-JRJ7]|nr:hypothetical protein [Calothrix sp. FI2-JRJ7]